MTVLIESTFDGQGYMYSFTSTAGGAVKCS